MTHVKNEGDVFLGSRQVDGLRYYDIQKADGEKVSYPSVTSVFQALPKPRGLIWFENNHPYPELHRATRAMIGSTSHYYFECKNAKYLPGHIPEMEDIPFLEYFTPETAHIIGNINTKLKLFTMINKLRPRYLEVPVWSHDMKVAGRIDFAGEFNGRDSLVDLKTAKRFYPVDKDAGEYDLHALQQTAYKYGLIDTYGYEVDHAFILRCNEANSPEVKQLEFDLEGFLEVREIFKTRYESDPIPA